MVRGKEDVEKVLFVGNLFVGVEIVGAGRVQGNIWKVSGKIQGSSTKVMRIIPVSQGSSFPSIHQETDSSNFCTFISSIFSLPNKTQDTLSTLTI